MAERATVAKVLAEVQFLGTRFDDVLKCAQIEGEMREQLNTKQEEIDNVQRRLDSAKLDLSLARQDYAVTVNNACADSQDKMNTEWVTLLVQAEGNIYKYLLSRLEKGLVKGTNGAVIEARYSADPLPRRNKISFIIALRQSLTRLGLKQAKDLVDALFDANPDK